MNYVYLSSAYFIIRTVPSTGDIMVNKWMITAAFTVGGFFLRLSPCLSGREGVGFGVQVSPIIGLFSVEVHIGFLGCKKISVEEPLLELRWWGADSGFRELAPRRTRPAPPDSACGGAQLRGAE